MVTNKSGRLDAVFAALSDATRRGILAQLAREGEAPVGDLAEPYSMSGPAISKHLRVLENAGLISRENQGRVRICRLKTRPIDDATAWLATTRSYWEGQLDALAIFLSKEPGSDR